MHRRDTLIYWVITDPAQEEPPLADALLALQSCSIGPLSCASFFFDSLQCICLESSLVLFLCSSCSLSDRDVHCSGVLAFLYIYESMRLIYFLPLRLIVLVVRLDKTIPVLFFLVKIHVFLEHRCTRSFYNGKLCNAILWSWKIHVSLYKLTYDD